MNRHAIALTLSVVALIACGKKEAPPAPASTPPATTQPTTPAAAPDAATPTTAAPEATATTTEPDAAGTTAEADAAATVAEADAAATAAEGDAGATPATAGEVVLSIDAGPVAAAEVAPPKDGLAAEQVKALCDAARAADALECDGEGPCGCTVGRLGKAGPTAAALRDVRGGVIPGATRAVDLLIEADGAWKTAARLGMSESGNRGESAATVTVQGFGALDLGAAGAWVWVDAMERSEHVETGTHWRRTLWLCGGTSAVACHGVPLKSWWMGKFEGMEDFQKEIGGPPTSTTERLYALAVTLDDAGALTVSAKTDKFPDDLKGLLGTHALAALGSVSGVVAPTVPE